MRALYSSLVSFSHRPRRDARLTIDDLPSPSCRGALLELGDRVHVHCQPEEAAAALERIFAGSV